jgi:hypothetical protein
MFGGLPLPRVRMFRLGDADLPDTRAAGAGQIPIELSPLVTSLESENSCGFEVRDSVAINSLTVYNAVREASREMSGHCLDRRMTGDYISQCWSL